jgi:hypothetical protein
VTDEEIRDFLASTPDVRTVARRAREWIGVQASRTCPGATYIPMAGDRRYE